MPKQNWNTIYITRSALNFITTLDLMVDDSKESIVQKKSFAKGLETSPRSFSIFVKTPMKTKGIWNMRRYSRYYLYSKTVIDIQLSGTGYN